MNINSKLMKEILEEVNQNTSGFPKTIRGDRYEDREEFEYHCRFAIERNYLEDVKIYEMDAFTCYAASGLTEAGKIVLAGLKDI